jgi:hypothetical protein
MPWAKFEDNYLGNQKLATLTTAAIALDMAAIIYSARELRDGLLSAADVQTVAALIHLRRWPPAAAELVRVHRWTTPDGAFYAIHDYLEYQPSRDEVLKQREEDRERKRRGGRARQGQNSSGIPAGNPPESGGIPAAPVPGPGPGPGIPATPESFPTPYPSPQAGKGARPSGANGSLTNGSTTHCCLIAELSDGREHSNSCSVAVELVRKDSE